jgi:hypothetical protein
MRRYLPLSIIAMLAIILTGCAPQVLPTSEPVSPVAIPTKGGSDTVSPLPAPTLALTAVAQEPGKGGAMGVAFRFDGTPMKGITIYAALVEMKNGVKLAAVDPVLDVRATTDAQGRFSLPNLRPGEYAIATQSPVGVILPHNRKNEIVMYQVKADEVIDLGHLDLGYVYPDS